MSMELPSMMAWNARVELPMRVRVSQAQRAVDRTAASSHGRPADILRAVVDVGSNRRAPTGVTPMTRPATVATTGGLIVRDTTSITSLAHGGKGDPLLGGIACLQVMTRFR